MEIPRKLDSGKWQARYTAPEGSRRSAGTFDTKKLAEEAAARAIADISRGVWSNETAGDERFSDYAAVVLEARKGELTYTSWKGFECQIRLRLIPYFGKYGMRDIRPTTVKHWWSTVETTASNRRNAYMALSSIMKHALDDEIIPASPCRVKGAGRDVTKRRPEFTLHEFWKIYDAADEDFKIFLLVTMDGGLRAGEVTGLNRSHFDPTTGRLTIEQQLAYEPGGFQMKPGTKTSREGRSLTLTPYTTVELAAYLGRRHTPADAPMFTNRRGDRLNRKTAAEKWKTLREEVGVEWAHLHDLRHTGLTAYARAGATDRDLMERAGHTGHRSHLRYQHSSIERDAENAARMGQMLRRKPA